MGLVLLMACGTAMGFSRGTVRYAASVRRSNLNSNQLDPVYGGSPVYGSSPVYGNSPAYGGSPVYGGSPAWGYTPSTGGRYPAYYGSVRNTGGGSSWASPSLSNSTYGVGLSGGGGGYALPRSAANAPSYSRGPALTGPGSASLEAIPIIPGQEDLPREPQGTPAPNDPMAILRRMSDYLGNLPRLQIGTQDTMDEILDSGEKVQLSSWRSFHVVRPDRLVADIQGDLANKRFWYDGKTGTLLDRAKNVFGTFSFAGTIDGLLDEARFRYHVAIPIIDLLYSDIAGMVGPSILAGQYVGRHQAGGYDCHHLAFTQGNCDWEIWIQAEGPPLPRKLVIVYKEREGKPRFSALLPYWETNPDFKPGLFTPEIPPGTKRVEMPPVVTKEDRQEAGERQLSPARQ